MQVTRGRRKAKRLGPDRVTTDDLLDLVGSIYEAGVDHRRWPDVMQQTIRVMGNSGCHLLLSDDRSGQIVHSVHINMPDRMIREYNTDVIRVCPRVASSKVHPERHMFWDYQHTDEKGINGSEYYDWLQRSGDNIRYYLASRLQRAERRDESLTYLSLAFRRREGHASRAHIRLFARLVPHFNRALEIGRRVGTGELARVASLEFLDLLPDAVILLDAAGRILAANRPAHALAQQGPLLLGSTGVRLANRRQDASLRALLAGATGTAKGQGIAGGGVIRLIGSPERVLSVVPLVGDSTESTLALARVAVFIRAAPQAIVPAAEDLQSGFGLTAAEARLARALAGGSSLARVAKDVGVSIHTARAQLKQVLGKTGTHRQADLVRVLLGAATRPIPRAEDSPA